MANDINSCCISGRLTASPETAYTQAGTAYVKFSIASNYYAGKGNDSGVSFIDCIAWGKLSEIVGEYCAKGTQVFLSGEVRQQRWDDKNTGKTRSRIEIVVGSLRMAGEKKEGYTKKNPKQYSAKQNPIPPNAFDDIGDDEIPF
jgi:single-strand DNA-binding protein